MPATPGGPVRRLLGLLRPYRPHLAAIIVLGIGSTALSLAGPAMLGRATDLIFAGLVSRQLPPGSTKEQAIAQLRADGDNTLATVFTTVDLRPGEGVDFSRLAVLLVLVILVYAVVSSLMLVQGWLIASVVGRVVRELRESVAAKLTRLPIAYFDRHPQGELLSRVTNDVDNLQMTVQQTVGQMVNSVFAIVGVLAVMFAISPVLALIVLVSVPVSALFARWISKRAQPRFGEQWATTGALSAHIEEMYTGHGLVKGFGGREIAERSFDRHNEELYTAGSLAQVLSGMIGPATRFISDLNYVLVAVVGALRVASGSITVGDVQAVVQYSVMFSRPVVDVANFSGQVQSGLASAERIFALLDAEEQSQDPDRPVRPVNVRGQVEFEQVSFRYLPGTPLIDDLSLSVEPGQMVAIVGETGAGKTTLGSLLMRFYEVDAGRVLVDGNDVTWMTRDDLRSTIGLVSQDVWLFGGTIAENIGYGRAGATREEIEEAARSAYADRFVRALPNGYDTVLDDESSSVSAGERQLITLARAFLAKSAILVLDEATSSVDTRTEVLIQRAMNSLRANRTSFVIAHRLSTIHDADVILVMNSGRIVERGTHDELIRAEGAYAKLHGLIGGGSNPT
ncbi:MAG: ABC transporter ATP-binding protein [Umezawaea sp.]